jgi:hypothetical protein
MHKAMRSNKQRKPPAPRRLELRKERVRELARDALAGIQGGDGEKATFTCRPTTDNQFQ